MIIYSTILYIIGPVLDEVIFPIGYITSFCFTISAPIHVLVVHEVGLYCRLSSSTVSLLRRISVRICTGVIGEHTEAISLASSLQFRVGDNTSPT